MRENTVAGKSEEKHAVGLKRRQKRNACSGSTEEKQGWGPSLSSHPLPRRQIQILGHRGIVRGIRKFPLPSLPDTWFPVKGRGRREKKGQGSKWHSKSLFNEKTLAWRWESCPGWQGCPGKLGLSGGCHSRGADGADHHYFLRHRQSQPLSMSAPACAWPLLPQWS